MEDIKSLLYFRELLISSLKHGYSVGRVFRAKVGARAKKRNEGAFSP